MSALLSLLPGQLGESRGGGEKEAVVGGLGWCSILFGLKMQLVGNGRDVLGLEERVEVGAGGSGVVGRGLSVTGGGMEAGGGVIGWKWG